MKRAFIVGAALICAVALCCFAQPSSEIRVRVTDLTGAGLGGAHVLIRGNAAKSMAADVTAMEDGLSGDYAAEVEPGVYDVFVSAPCQLPIATQLKVTADKPEILRVQMKPQQNFQSAYSFGCPTPDDFGTPIDFNIYSPALPDNIPFPGSGDKEKN